MKSPSMIGVGIIGYGYWGPNLVRNFALSSGSRVVAVSDLDEGRLAQAQQLYNGIHTTTDYQKLITDKSVDAVVIATPVATHFDLASKALQEGKHVLVTKPLASNSQQAEQLIEQSTRLNRVLMIDHTFIYTGAVNKIRELVNKGRLGDIYYYDSVRINLGLFQHDVNVIWDLAVHDLSIMDYILSPKPQAVSATGMSHVKNQPENIAFLTLFFENSLIAHIHVNWLAPVKLRRTLISGSKNMVVYDDLELSEKVKVYDKGVDVAADRKSIYEMLVGYRSGDMTAPQLDRTEALRTEVSHFIHCIETGDTPLSDGESGLRIVRVMEAANRSMQNQGALEKLAS
jgi:predicted dehydrogenase